MKRLPGSAVTAVAAPVARDDSSSPGLLGNAALVLMAAALTVRPILGEMWTVQVSQLVNPSPLWWNTSPAVMYISHVVAAVGVVLGGLWIARRRRTWRFTGLEPAVLLMVLAAVISVPGASDRRTAINVAVGTILPMIVAAVLVQMVAACASWRRVLVAALIAAAVANCYRSTRQQVYEYEETWQHYLKNKAEYWARQGKSLNDPTIEIFESRIRAHQPQGYFYHPNVMASFLLLGVAVAAAAAVARAAEGTDPGGGARSRRGEGVLHPRGDLDAPGHRDRQAAPAVRRGWPVPWKLLSLICLAGVILWQLVVIQWVGSVGAKVGIGVGVATAAAAWSLRGRPRTAALLCAAVLAGLQLALVVLALRADATVPRLTRHGGKLRSLAFRLDYDQGALRLFAQHPLRGVGPGQFGRAYPSVKAIRAAEEVAHPHNWLLSVAAEWGILGLLGTVAALALPAWVLLRAAEKPATRAPPGGAIAQRPRATGEPMRDATSGSTGNVVLLALGTVLGGWLIFLPGVVPAGTSVFLVETFWALPLALACAALVCIAQAEGRAWRIALLAGLAAFIAHGMVEMTSGVAGAMWPFWAVVALALSPDRGTAVAAVAASGRRLRPSLALLLSAGLMVMALTVNPVRAIWAMNQAKNAFSSSQPGYAEAPLLEACAADGLDPGPRTGLSEFYRRVAYANRPQAASYLRKAVHWSNEALRLDPRNHTLWHDAAWIFLEYASASGDASASTEAVKAMRRAVELYPNWPRGHLNLATVLERAGNAPDAARELAKALQLDEGWPAEDPNKLSQDQVQQVQARCRQLLRAQAPASAPQADP